MSDLSRDTDNAHEKLNTIFDKEKEQKRIEKVQLIVWKSKNTYIQKNKLSTNYFLHIN
ncbi:hypothetical protein [Providencia alcalifaciens]|uniref:hypothetical protein n=1 Tax=Providencia alcalifaciens TaxID=126385 RepID=UPI001CC4C6F0